MNYNFSFKVNNLFFSFIYIIVFTLAYEKFLFFYFEYVGFEMYNKIDYQLLIPIFIILIPVFFYRGFNTVSSAIASLIYILLYVPIILTFYFASRLGLAYTIFIQFVFSACMLLLFLSDYIHVKINQFKTTIKFNHIFKICLILCLYICLIYRNNLKFVSFEDVYELRSENNDLGSDVFTSYLSSWLYNVFVPICFSYGVFYKKYMGIFIGIISCVVIYMATASKAAILLPFIYLGFFIVLRKNSFNLLSTILKLLSIIIFILLFIDFNFISSILLSRTIGNGGLLTFWYFDYFSIHPKTYFSHVNIVEFIFQIYPYGNLGVGQVVGPYYWGELMNANANFWATDGIASFGVFGIVVITLIVFIFLVLLNSITKKHNKVFVLYCFLPFILSLTNTSFFSSLLTGGGGMLALFFMFNQDESSLNKSI